MGEHKTESQCNTDNARGVLERPEEALRKGEEQLFLLIFRETVEFARNPALGL